MPAPPTTPLPSRHVTVLVHTGEAPGKFRFLKSEITLGKGAHCDLRLGREADEIHCILSATRHGYMLEDLRTYEGTYVDGEAITQAFVEPGQRLQAGWTTFEVLEASTTRPSAQS